LPDIFDPPNKEAVDQLTRIAVALERIASQLERSKPVPERAIDKTLSDYVATISSAANRPKPAK